MFSFKTPKQRIKDLITKSITAKNNEFQSFEVRFFVVRYMSFTHVSMNDFSFLDRELKNERNFKKKKKTVTKKHHCLEAIHKKMTPGERLALASFL